MYALSTPTTVLPWIFLNILNYHIIYHSLSLYLSITVSSSISICQSINQPLPLPKYQYIITADPGGSIGLVIISLFFIYCNIFIIALFIIITLIYYYFYFFVFHLLLYIFYKCLPMYLFLLFFSLFLSKAEGQRHTWVVVLVVCGRRPKTY